MTPRVSDLPAGFGELPAEYPHVQGSWESDASHFPLPLSPAFASLYLPWQEEGLEGMFRAFGYLGGSVRSRLIDGRLYYRVGAAGGWTPPRWFAPHAARFWPFSPPIAARVLRSLRRRRSRFHARVLERWRTHWRGVIEAELREALRLHLPDLSDTALAGQFDAACAFTGRNVRLHFLLHGAIAPPLYELQVLLDSTPALEGVRLADLLAGASPASSDPAAALAAVARDLAARPAALARARELGAAAVAACPSRVDATFAAALADWLSRYGHRVLDRYELIEPAVAEQPERIVGRVLAMADWSVAGRTPESAGAEAIRDARRRLSGAALERFDSSLAAARNAYAVRDDNVVLTYNTSFAAIRYLLLEIGRRWSGGLLRERDDVFFLTAAEIRAGLRGGDGAGDDALGPAAAARRRTWQRQRQHPSPPALVGPPLTLPALTGLPADAAFMTAAIVWYLRAIQSLTVADAALVPASVSGLGASPGRYRGVARVVRSVDEFDRVAPGEVLVCAMTSPAWSAILPLAGALVTEHGGPLSHPAVIAREFGIPAVVGARAATMLIADGSVVVVDGQAGRVELAG